MINDSFAQILPSSFGVFHKHSEASVNYALVLTQMENILARGVVRYQERGQLKYGIKDQQTPTQLLSLGQILEII